MNKSIKVVGAVIIVFLIVFAVFGKISLSGEKKNSFNDDPIENNEAHFNVPGNDYIKLFIANYKLENGFQYSEVTLSDDQKKEIINVMSKVIKDSISNETVYGKYKLEYGTETIFFDLDNNSALYDNKIIYFEKEEKIKIANDNDHCSCCTTSNCNMNICGCQEDL